MFLAHFYRFRLYPVAFSRILPHDRTVNLDIFTFQKFCNTFDANSWKNGISIGICGWKNGMFSQY